ncbi:MAG: hypothetical protein ACJAVR_002899 [Paracoccaceae bacterium]|jgi:hypothetical protein
MATSLREPPKDCIQHTDRSSQYCSHDDQTLLRQSDFNVFPLVHVNMHCQATHERQGKLL